jgi:Pectinacetylesterase
MRRRPSRSVVSWVRATLGLALAATVAATLAGPLGAGRAVAWQQVDSGGRTLCGRGGPFAFWVRLADPKRLLVYFEGGGFCWDYRSCRADAALFKDQVTDRDDPARHGTGILDLTQPGNPFRNWSVLYIPSCTGDLYAGDSIRTYASADGRSVSVHHRGHVNATAALDWAFQHVPRPDRVVVVGCSAGSIGSILHVPGIIERYPDARVAQLGDSLGYLLGRPGDMPPWRRYALLPDWLPAVRALGRARLTMPRLYDAVAGSYPGSTFGQVNFRQDAVQRAYFAAAGGRPQDFDRVLLGNLAEIRGAAPNFRSCLLDGSGHCALSSGEFYRLRSGQVALRDWVAELAAGRDLPNLPASDDASTAPASVSHAGG